MATRQISTGCLLVCVLTSPSWALDLFSLGAYNTGVDNSGKPLSQGAIDPHYILNGTDDVVLTNIVDGVWIPNDSQSRWVSTNPNGGDTLADPSRGTVPSGFYDYEINLDLTGKNTAAFELELLYAGDNQVEIQQNGTSVAGSLTPMSDSGTQFYPITLTNQTGGGWLPTTNSLVFVVENFPAGPGPNPSGVRVQFVAAVPEPAAIVLFMLAVMCWPNRCPLKKLSRTQQSKQS